MKLFYVDSKNNSHFVAEADSFEELIGPMIGHQRSRFIYHSGTFIPPGRVQPGQAYTVYRDKAGTYEVRG